MQSFKPCCLRICYRASLYVQQHCLRCCGGGRGIPEKVFQLGGRTDHPHPGTQMSRSQQRNRNYGPNCVGEERWGGESWGGLGKA